MCGQSLMMVEESFCGHFETLFRSETGSQLESILTIESKLTTAADVHQGESHKLFRTTIQAYRVVMFNIQNIDVGWSVPFMFFFAPSPQLINIDKTLIDLNFTNGYIKFALFLIKPVFKGITNLKHYMP